MELRLLDAGGTAHLTAGQAVWSAYGFLHDDVDLALHSGVSRERIAGRVLTLEFRMRRNPCSFGRNPNHDVQLISPKTRLMGHERRR